MMRSQSQRHSRRKRGDNKEVFLTYSKHEKVAMKDFAAEVRGVLDVEHFLHQAVLLLDISETSLEGVVDMMLQRMLAADEPQCTPRDVKAALFTNDTVNLLARTIQSSSISDNGSGFDFDQSWLCALCNFPTLQRRHVAITRLRHTANFGRTSHEVRLFVIILCPSKEKGTKNALEMGRTFCTLLADMDFKQRLLEAHSEEDFKTLVLNQTKDLAAENKTALKPLTYSTIDVQNGLSFSQVGRGIYNDLKRRLPHYRSDFTDGWSTPRSVHKVVATSLSLYFACILPAIAFGVLNHHNTHGKIDVKKVIIGQIIGGLFFSSFGGQPLLLLLTTAPLAIYIKIIHTISKDFDIDFYAMYCCVGLWNTFFLIIMSLFNVSKIIKWSTRSTEEIFSLFICVAFFVDAFVDVYTNFKENFNSEACKPEATPNRNRSYEFDSSDLGNESQAASSPAGKCNRETTILFVLLMLGTLWLSVSLYKFNKTPYLEATKREMMADYSLPAAVLIVSFIGSYVFQDVTLERFTYGDGPAFSIAPLHKLTTSSVFGAMGLGFPLSILLFMDQNITSAIVNNPSNKLKKGSAYHLDLLVVAVLNGGLSLLGMPWMVAMLPHSPLHLRSLADVEERVDQGHVYEIIVRVRETRVTGLISHVLIALSVFLLPYPLAYIPIAVLDGLFLYMAVTALSGNQMFERITLMFMEQAAYPPNHYIRRVPQRKIHAFTAFQVLQLGIMCVFGFAPWPYVDMMFPFVIMLLIPVRHCLVPLFIEDRYLQALDG